MWHSKLGTWCCHCSSSGCYRGAGLIPGPGTSTCQRGRKTKKKERKEKKKKKINVKSWVFLRTNHFYVPWGHCASLKYLEVPFIFQKFWVRTLLLWNRAKFYNFYGNFIFLISHSYAWRSIMLDLLFGTVSC